MFFHAQKHIFSMTFADVVSLSKFQICSLLSIKIDSSNLDGNPFLSSIYCT